MKRHGSSQITNVDLIELGWWMKVYTWQGLPGRKSVRGCKKIENEVEVYLSGEYWTSIRHDTLPELYSDSDLSLIQF